jgi:hypothetical protein
VDDSAAVGSGVTAVAGGSSSTAPARRALTIACAVLALGSVSAAAAQPTLSIKRGKKIVQYTRSVSVSGRLSTRKGGVRVLLQSDRWPFDSFKTVAGTKTGDKGGYRFRRKPTLGTRYRVVLERNRAVRSRAVTVYLTSLSRIVSCNYCDHKPKGHGQFTFRVVDEWTSPPGLSPRRLYFYWGQVDGDANAWPPEVRRVKSIQPKRVAPGKVRFRIRYRFTVPDRPYSFVAGGCSRDHFARDGFGIPGHHHCGDAKIAYPAYNGYVG